jgi:hypothetical protein
MRRRHAKLLEYLAIINAAARFASSLGKLLAGGDLEMTPT